MAFFNFLVTVSVKTKAHVQIRVINSCLDPTDLDPTDLDPTDLDPTDLDPQQWN